jgi:hypothetical protein
LSPLGSGFNPLSADQLSLGTLSWGGYECKVSLPLGRTDRSLSLGSGVNTTMGPIATLLPQYPLSRTGEESHFPRASGKQTWKKPQVGRPRYLGLLETWEISSPDVKAVGSGKGVAFRARMLYP